MTHQKNRDHATKKTVVEIRQRADPEEQARHGSPAPGRTLHQAHQTENVERDPPHVEGLRDAVVGLTHEVRTAGKSSINF